MSRLGFLSRRTVAGKLVLVGTCFVLAILLFASAATHFARTTSKSAELVYQHGIVNLLVATQLELVIASHRRIVESAPAEVDREVLAGQRRQLELLNRQLLAEITAAAAAAASGFGASSIDGVTVDRHVRKMIGLADKTLHYSENIAQDSAQEAAREYGRLASRLNLRASEYRAQRVKTVEAETHRLTQNADLFASWTGICIALIFLLLGPLGFYVLRDVFVRLSVMRSVVQGLSSGHNEIQVPFTANLDEIGDLARSLDLFKANAVALHEAKHTLAEQNAKLERLSESLEIRVAERTKEAERAVRTANEANANLLREISQKTEIEADLRAANGKLQVATQAKTQFLANMSHEIRTPMNGIFGITDLLTRTKLDERQQRLANTISESARTLLTIINDILDLSSIEAGKLTLNSHVYEFSSCVEDATALLAEIAQRKGVDLNLFIHADVVGSVEADSGRLRQVLLNLIGNAVKFTNQGEVSVQVLPAGPERPVRHVAFHIRDTGIGIDAAMLEKLFQPFTQADSSISRRFGGTGLGLSISRHLVAMMGGEIAIESQPGMGTHISFELPLAISPAPGAALAPIDKHLAGQRILVVDGKKSNREIICSYLETHGFEVESAEEARDALAQLKAAVRSARPFALAISDLNSPENKTREMHRQIVADPDLKSTKLVGLSSLSGSADLGVLGEAVVHKILHKPIRRQDLIRTVTQLLTQYESAAPAEELVAAPGSALAKTPDLRVLLAEDNPVNQIVALEYLELQGCIVTVVDNGLHAVAAFERESFDVILMDCQMPEMDGLAASLLIRELECERNIAATPIIAVTANAFEEDRIRCLEAGMDDFLRKPFTEAQLTSALVKWRRTPSVVAPPNKKRKPRANQSPVKKPTSCSKSKPSVASPASATGTAGSLKSTRPGLHAKLLAIFIEHAPSLTAAMTRDVGQKDLSALALSAHSLKSSSANVGADGISALCRQLEAAAKDDNLTDCESIVPRIEQAIGQLIIEAKSRLPLQSKTKVA